MLPKREKLLQTGLALHAFASAITLAVFAWHGFFSRYMADDYCHSGLLKAYGFWGAIQHHYLTFSNRYMILVVPFITDLFGVRGQSWLPALRGWVNLPRQRLEALTASSKGERTADE